MCIEYPGLVNNVDKMVQTLGGISNIGIVSSDVCALILYNIINEQNQVYSAKNRRVELRFRPDDIYCKPTCGDRSQTFSLLLKVKVKKALRNPNAPCSSKDPDSVKTITFTTSVIGVVDTIYKFGSKFLYYFLLRTWGFIGIFS